MASPGDASPDQLRSMELQAITNLNDEKLAYGRWNRWDDVHKLAKETYQADKPQDWWRYALGAPTGPLSAITQL